MRTSSPGNFRYFRPKLAHHDVSFILVGGGAAIAQGLARTTYDVDIVYERNQVNFEKLVSALADSNPYYRGAPPGLPFKLDVETLRAGLNFTFRTDFGDIDLLGEVTGGGDFNRLKENCDEIVFLDSKVMVVSLEMLIELKRAAGRPKDFEAIAELEALKEERDKFN